MKIARKELSSTLLAISLKSFEESLEFWAIALKFLSKLFQLLIKIMNWSNCSYLFFKMTLDSHKFWDKRALIIIIIIGY